MRIVFVHPDLGIGGAERLVVDAAVGLISQGHQVIIYTSHHDPQHAFLETTDGTLPIIVYGDFLPSAIAGRFKIACALLRSIYLSTRLLIQSPFHTADLIVFDQISGCSIVLSLMGIPLVFYCHFPDMLLSDRSSILRRVYRFPFDAFEQLTTSLADCILVNSNFTKGVFARTFRFIGAVPEVLYPGINLAKYDRKFSRDKAEGLPSPSFDASDAFVLLSINRFERKKNIRLAIEAMALLRPPRVSPTLFNRVKLVVAGGYDHRVIENVEYELELKQCAKGHDLSISDFPDMSGQVVFLRSFSDDQRSYLLERCLAVVYTPENEHFGIVPIEAMYAGRPVIAANSGGPLESVIHSKTGFLCDPLPDAFATQMQFLIEHVSDAAKMGKSGRKHVQDRFSLKSFSSRLSAIVTETDAAFRRRTHLPLHVARAALLLLLAFMLSYLLS